MLSFLGMRSLIVLLAIGTTFVIAMTLGVLWLKSEPQRSRAAPYSAPFDFLLPRVLGQSEFAFSSVNDRVTIVNFWATWCEPCQRELPALLQLASELGPDYLFILISVDDSKQELLKFLKAFDYKKSNVELLWDQGSSIGRKFGTQRLPESYVFDRARKLDRKVVGYIDWNESQMRDYLIQLRGKSDG